MCRWLLTQAISLAILSCFAGAQIEKSASSVVGQWEGESICTVKNSPCHDEHVIYRITQDTATPQKLALAAYKVVKGEELYMGDLECRYAAENSELRCHYKPTDEWLYKLAGNSLKGTLIINGNTLYRKIDVKRVAVTPVKGPQE